MAWEKINAAARELKKMKISYKMEQHEEQTELRIPCSGKNGWHYTIRLIGNESAGVMGLYAYCLFSDVPLRKCRQLLPLLNDLNGRYRFFRFYFDADGDVNAAYDFPDHSPAPEKGVVEGILRMKNVLRDVYPELKAALESVE